MFAEINGVLTQKLPPWMQRYMDGTVKIVFAEATHTFCYDLYEMLYLRVEYYVILWSLLFFLAQRH